MKIIFIKSINFLSKNPRWMFIITILVVCILQFSLLGIILKNGITADDWLLLFDYKLAGSSINFLEKFFAVLNAKGIYSTTYIFYIGFLESLFKGNYQAYQITNIIFKTLATLSLYPLILIVFKRKSLAFLTTILYAISYSSSGALQFVVKGSDYLAIFFMNICLITYYLSFKTKRKFLFIISILLFLAFLFSPIRIYPFLLFIILVEVFAWIKSKGLMGPIFALLRLIILFSPFLILVLFLPQSTGGYLSAPKIIYQFLSYGNYQLLLTPFAGLGYTFLPNDYWSIFGQLNLDSFREYMLFLLRGPVIIYSILTIFLGFLITKKPLPFISGVILTNIVFEVICYFLITNLRGMIGPNIKGFHPVSTYAIFFGFFVMSIAISSLIIWLKNKSNILLLSLFAGPIFASVFLWGTWLIIGDSLTFKEGIHWYLIIPPIGSSLFLASLMILGLDRIRRIVNLYSRWVLITCLFLIILPIYLISSKEINTTFSYYYNIGYGASDQEEMKSKLLSYLTKPFDENPTLIYLDTSENNLVDPLFYPVTLISGFGEKIHFRNWEIVNGCVGLIYDRATLEKSVVVQDGVKGFTAGSLCIYNYFSAGRPEMFYKPENFYALKLKGREVIDIRKETLKNLGFGD